MKKIFLYILAGSLCFSACKKDDDDVVAFIEPENIEVRNTYDEQAIQKFMDNNYLDTQGNIKAFSSTDAADDNFKKLSELSPVKLPSGVIYIKREGAQPNPGKTIDTNPESSTASLVKTMMRATYYLATDNEGNVALTSAGSLTNSIDLTGSPITDPTFYYAKRNIVTDAKPRSYYEIEGLQEGLKYFNGFENLPNSTLPNLQGVIIVPSKAAFARDANFYNLQNACFVFNFQIYHTETRPEGQK
ncbi:hypothetical protein CHRY9390_00705 [Chryseobacterium aquaeductus]|uniref:Uncharacterized protein n=1 Tax=Chryseobacterium aquaeductus TaxID=2675056 RepID=A0A9N8MLF4_9FLAO|nr:hypothetical protein [Chryseobacterium aquaeductus]CAA7330052.1 hypothetical protein CHRY9390_00705 [Chryseobacterium potabilaquae]CAD7800936.1 hypothetical protein CHRY9390_00705 [Chryseobacterium aquaeductus]